MTHSLKVKTKTIKSVVPIELMKSFRNFADDQDFKYYCPFVGGKRSTCESK